MNARCKRIEEQLGRYAAGELSEARRARVAEHLEACAGCRRRAAEAAELETLLTSSFQSHPFGEALADRIVAGVRSGRATTGRPQILAGPGSWRAVLPFAAAAALLLAVGLGVRRWVAPAPVTHGEPRAIASVRGISDHARIAVRQGGEGPAVTATPGATVALRPGDRVLVESVGAEVRFRDGTRVQVRPDTEVTLVARASEGTGRGEGVRITGGPGEVFCSVPHRPAGAGFRVETPQGEVEVLGTRFGVRCEGARTLATVLSGVVRVRGAWGRTWSSVTAGRRVVLDPAARVALAVVKTNAAADLSWAMSGRSGSARSGSARSGSARSGTAGRTDPAPRPAAAPAGAGHPRPPASAAAQGGSSLDLPIGASPDGEE